jgi:[protein]-arginine 3-hydroxylase / protease
MENLGSFDYRSIDFNSKLILCDNKTLPLFVLNYLKQIKDGLETNDLCEVNKLIRMSVILIEFSHGMLNTNLWIFVDDIWRLVYGHAVLYKIVLLCKKISLKNIKTSYSLPSYIIKLCDLGLLMSGNLLEDKFNHILNQIKSTSRDLLFEKKTIENISNVENLAKTEIILDQNHLIKVEKSPSIDSFKENYFLPKVPVIIESQMDHWPAIEKWSVDYIEDLVGKRTVPIELGKKYTNPDWSQKLMTINEFINKFIRKTNVEKDSVGYLAQHPLFDQVKSPKNSFFLSWIAFLNDTMMEGIILSDVII